MIPDQPQTTTTGTAAPGATTRATLAHQAKNAEPLPPPEQQPWIRKVIRKLLGIDAHDRAIRLVAKRLRDDFRVLLSVQRTATKSTDAKLEGVRRDLDDAVQREQTLLGRVHTLTTAVNVLYDSSPQFRKALAKHNAIASAKQKAARDRHDKEEAERREAEEAEKAASAAAEERYTPGLTVEDGGQERSDRSRVTTSLPAVEWRPAKEHEAELAPNPILNDLPMKPFVDRTEAELEEEARADLAAAMRASGGVGAAEMRDAIRAWDADRGESPQPAEACVDHGFDREEAERLAALYNPWPSRAELDAALAVVPRPLEEMSELDLRTEIRAIQVRGRRFADGSPAPPFFRDDEDEARMKVIRRALYDRTNEPYEGPTQQFRPGSADGQ